MSADPSSPTGEAVNPAPRISPVQAPPDPGLSREVDLLPDGRRITYYSRAEKP